MAEKKSKREKKPTIEEIYKNKNFVPPKEKNLETIFEEPRKAKDGAPILTSVRKYKRFLHFDPTEGKIQKRKLKAKKCINKLKNSKLRTRSAKKTVQCEDISMYISEQMGESSDSEMEECSSAATTEVYPGQNNNETDYDSSKNNSTAEKREVKTLQHTKDESDQVKLKGLEDSVVPDMNSELLNSFSKETEVVSSSEASSPRSSCLIA